MKMFKGLSQPALLLAIAVAFSAYGCSGQQFGLGSESQEFGNKVAYNTQVDVLWVIDTSSSMDTYQNLLAPQVSVLVDSMNQTGLDYHMAVTTMDMSSNGLKGRFAAAAGTPAILTNQTPNLTQILSQRIQLGGTGSPVERGEEAMRAALSAPLSSVNGANAGFLRPDALLVVIFLSNENDSSASVDYVAALDALHPPFADSGSRSWLAQFMGVTSADPSCQTSQWQQAGFAGVGTKYMSLAAASGGLSEPICDLDLRRALTNVKGRILEVMTEYHLDRTPNLQTMQVYVDGRLIPQSAANGWTFFASTNSVRFHGSAVPTVNSRILINYDPSGIK